MGTQLENRIVSGSCLFQALSQSLVFCKADVLTCVVNFFFFVPFVRSSNTFAEVVCAINVKNSKVYE